MKVKKAIIPAAGLGTRFLPVTKAQPKEMLPIVDTPTIQYIIQEAVEAGIEDILIITGRNKRAIEDHFDKSFELEMTLQQKGKTDVLKMVQDISNMANIHYIRQKEPKGLGHAIYCGETFIKDEPFAVLLGDDVVWSPQKPCIKQLIDAYEKYNTSIIGVQEVPHSEVYKYGIISGNKIDDRLYKIDDLVEKPSVDTTPSNIAILGRYIITPEIFEILKYTKKGAGGEIQLTDALKTLSITKCMYAYVFEGKRYDVGNMMGFLTAMVEFALRKDSIKDEFKEYLIHLLKNEPRT
ncbi:UTP--glucose-1-phosphate uridylyltransferase GalU [Abyssisolibacter fermentans]|uniref:UTP--glucose-1-phosphate uridylyltransferase GalU n=1 Tax=Abyssisolibacter fermentans TaxID=1766203 RepID=UPI000833E6EC|nr:UTP--glucose-1-phosphate uridylyltransferase GalU [Abyssisolibacter fermentans]